MNRINAGAAILALFLSACAGPTRDDWSQPLHTASAEHSVRDHQYYAHLRTGFGSEFSTIYAASKMQQESDDFARAALEVDKRTKDCNHWIAIREVSIDGSGFAMDFVCSEDGSGFRFMNSGSNAGRIMATTWTRSDATRALSKAIHLSELDVGQSNWTDGSVYFVNAMQGQSSIIRRAAYCVECVDPTGNDPVSSNIEEFSKLVRFVRKAAHSE